MYEGRRSRSQDSTSKFRSTVVKTLKPVSSSSRDDDPLNLEKKLFPIIQLNSTKIF
jgi:hypothetical protein